MGDTSSVSELSEDLEVTHEDHLKKQVDIATADGSSRDLFREQDSQGATPLPRRRSASSPSKQTPRKVVHRISKIMMNNNNNNGSSSNSSGGGGDGDGGVNSNNNNKHRHGGGVASFLSPSLDRRRTAGGLQHQQQQQQPQQQRQQQAPKHQPQPARLTPPRGNNNRRVGDNSSHASSSGGSGVAAVGSGGGGGGGDGSSTDDTRSGGGDKSIGMISMDGMRSVMSSQTISSHDTIKASNHQHHQQQQTTPSQQQQKPHRSSSSSSKQGAAFRRKRRTGNTSNNSDSNSQSTPSYRGGGGGEGQEEAFLLPSVGEEEHTPTPNNRSPRNKRWGKLKRALGVNRSSNNNPHSSYSLAGVSTMTGADASAAAASAPGGIQEHYHYHHHHHQHHYQNFCLNLPKFVLPARRQHVAEESGGGGGGAGRKNSAAAMLNLAMCRARSQKFNSSSEGVDNNNNQTPSATDIALADFSRIRLNPETSSTSLWASRLDLEKLDESIRGRMDGMDVMSLGSAMLFTSIATYSSPSAPSTATTTATVDNTSAAASTDVTTTHHNPWSILPIHYSFAGTPTDYSPAQMVTDMLRASGGRSPPEMILEGFLPGGDDRWSVRIEEEHQQQQQQQKQQHLQQQESVQQPCHDSLQPSLTATTMSSTGTNTACGGCGDSTTTAAKTSAAPVPSVPYCEPTDDCLDSAGHCIPSCEPPPQTDEYATLEDGSPAMPTHKLWSTLWGSDPAPSNNSKVLEEMNKNVASGGMDDVNALDDPLLHLAAESSIPIDIDEDTFIVSTREHLLAIQEIATVPLSIGRFESALRVYEKLCKGLDLSVNEECRFLRGSGRHNVGLVHMWMGNFQAAFDCLSRAEADRLQYLPRQHPDVAVTQTRKAQALVALGRLDEALNSLEQALVLTSADQVVRAKVLNNCGVVYFLKGESFHALKCFTSALEIQRKWLETGPVVRESIVFDASVSLGNMGKLYSQPDIADFEMSAKVYKEALLLQCNIYRPSDPVVLTSAQNYAMAKGRCISKSNNGRRAAIRLLQTCLRLQQGVGIKKLRGVENEEEDEESIELPPLRLQQPLASTAIVETVGRLAYLYAQQAMYENALLCFEAVQQWQTTNLPDPATCPNAAALLSATRANVDALKVKTVKTPSQRLDESIILATSCCGVVGGDGTFDKTHARTGSDVWV